MKKSRWSGYLQLGRPFLSFWTESNLVSALLRKSFLLWTFAKDGERQHVLVDGRLVLMTKTQARRYRELSYGKPSLSLLVNRSMNNDRI